MDTDIGIYGGKNALRVGFTKDRKRIFVLPGCAKIKHGKNEYVYQLSNRITVPMINAGYVVLRIDYEKQEIRLACVGKPFIGKATAEFAIAQVYRSYNGNALIMDLREMRELR